MKDLFKPGRPLDEYLNEDGSLKKCCLTCIHRLSINDTQAGEWLCSGGNKMNKKCFKNPNIHTKNNHYLLWKPRVDNGVFKETDFKLD